MMSSQKGHMSDILLENYDFTMEVLSFAYAFLLFIFNPQSTLSKTAAKTSSLFLASIIKAYF